MRRRSANRYHHALNNRLPCHTRLARLVEIFAICLACWLPSDASGDRQRRPGRTFDPAELLPLARSGGALIAPPFPAAAVLQTGQQLPEANPVVVEAPPPPPTPSPRRRGLEPAVSGSAIFFTLGGQPFRVLSGSIHYFRVPHQYWRDRLTKLKACGFNTVETYVPWNLHEENAGQFNFENKIEHSLDLVEFIGTAQSLDLYVILRPGPYICAEWDWGGHPSWLLQDPSMQVRTLHPGYVAATERYLAHLLALVVPLQYHYGGPIIAVQLENEYGSYASDKAYLRWLKNVLQRHGVIELLFTSDGQNELVNGTLPDVFASINFGTENVAIPQTLAYVKDFWSGSVMVGEFYSGWFDHWGEAHHRQPAEIYQLKAKEILDLGASLNAYVFHGGTNFGFMNGANRDFQLPLTLSSQWTFQPTVTSYDYDALVSESGQLTEKWIIMHNLLQNTELGAAKSDAPLVRSPPTVAFGTFPIEEYLELTDMLKQMPSVMVENPRFMEYTCLDKSMEKDEQLFAETPIGAGSCKTQNFGFVAYRKSIKLQQPPNPADKPRTWFIQLKGEIYDKIIVLINGRPALHTSVPIGSFYDLLPTQVYTVQLPFDQDSFDIIILIENLGRVNYARWPHGLDDQRKGFNGMVLLGASGELLSQWQVYSLDFTEEFWKRKRSEFSGWRRFRSTDQPALYRTKFSPTAAADTFVNMQGWTKGIVMVNKVNIGRYWNIGPQRSLYLPAPWLGVNVANEILVFEVQWPASSISFSDKHMLE